MNRAVFLLIPAGLVAGAIAAKSALASEPTPAARRPIAVKPENADEAISSFMESSDKEEIAAFVVSAAKGARQLARTVAQALQRRVKNTLVFLIGGEGANCADGSVNIKTVQGTAGRLGSGLCVSASEWKEKGAQIVENLARERFVLAGDISSLDNLAFMLDEEILATNRTSVFVLVHGDADMDTAIEATNLAARESQEGLRFVVLSVRDMPTEELATLTDCPQLGTGYEVFQGHPMLDGDGNIVMQRTGTEKTSCNPAVTLGPDPVEVLAQIIMDRRPGLGRA